MSLSIANFRRQFRRLAAIAGAATAGRAAADVRRATDCIVRKVSADPRYSADMRPNEINDLIVDSISACGRLVRQMIDAHDRNVRLRLGRGLPARALSGRPAAAVVQQVKAKVPAR